MEWAVVTAKLTGLKSYVMILMMFRLKLHRGEVWGCLSVMAILCACLAFLGAMLPSYPGRAIVEKVARVKRPGIDSVYNLSVRGNENYFVGHGRLLVHNCGVSPEVQNALEEALRSPNNYALIPPGTNKTGAVAFLDDWTVKTGRETMIERGGGGRHYVHVGSETAVSSYKRAEAGGKVSWHPHPRSGSWRGRVTRAFGGDWFSIGDITEMRGYGQRSSLLTGDRILFGPRVTHRIAFPDSIFWYQAGQVAKRGAIIGAAEFPFVLGSRLGIDYMTSQSRPSPTTRPASP